MEDLFVIGWEPHISLAGVSAGFAGIIIFTQFWVKLMTQETRKFMWLFGILVGAAVVSFASWAADFTTFMGVFPWGLVIISSLVYWGYELPELDEADEKEYPQVNWKEAPPNNTGWHKP